MSKLFKFKHNQLFKLHEKNVDIIVPIYNAIDYVKECVDSLLHVDHGVNNLKIYLINDCSTDLEIQKFINNVANFDNRFIAIHNEKNLGFVGTCNKGIQISDKNDVVLLNSDTKVTKNWLYKMQQVAYSRNNVATVSPFTNSGAGILNIPDFYKNNSIPANHTLDSWSDVVEEISIENSLCTYTNVGFCIYITRKAINKIGVLDYETFGKGNGEEIDFCLRARRAGFVNFIASNTFIQHEGSSVSYSELEKLEKNNAKKILVEKHTKIIEARYPEFNPWLNYILTKDPWIMYHRMFFLFAEFFSAKKRVVHLVNNIIYQTANGFGGTENIVDNIVNNIDEYDHYLMQVEQDKVIIYNVRSKITLYIPIRRLKLDSFRLRNNVLNEEIKKVLQVLNPNVFVFHTFRNLPTNIYEIFHELRIPFYYYMHDFSSICPSYWDVSIGIFEKHGGSIDESILSIAKSQKDKHYYIKRLKDVKILFKSANKLIVPSNYVFNLMKNFLGGADNIVYLENGISIEKISETEPFNEKEINVFWLGNFLLFKGADLFLDIVWRLKDKNSFKFHIFGEVSDKILKSRITDINKNNELIILHNYYQVKDLKNLLRKMHVCILPFKTEETYSLVLSELLNLNKYIITVNQGVFRDRLRNYDAGVTFDYDVFVDKAVDHLISLNQKIYNDELNRVSKVKCNHVKDTARNLFNLIESDVSHGNVNKNYDENIAWLRYLSLFYTLDILPVLRNSSKLTQKIKVKLIFFLLRNKRLYKFFKYLKCILNGDIKYMK